MSGEAASPETSPHGGEFPERVRKALRPLLADEALLESTALKIQSMMAVHWKFTDRSSFFDFAGKVGRIVTHFAPDGLTQSDYVRAAVRRGTLFFQNPETLIANIERVAAHFRSDGLTRQAYLKAACCQPSLFFRKPATIIRHVNLINGLYL